VIVPISSGSAASSIGEVPSETNLLMALATMHSYGKFDKDSTNSYPTKLPKPKTAHVGGEG
jgi:hypothetical protein